MSHIQAFVEMAIRSAKTYYRWLDDNGRGVSEIAISDISRMGSVFFLRLRTRLPVQTDASTLAFSCNGQLYTAHQLVPTEYDRLPSILTVVPRPEYAEMFARLTPDDIFLISDMKFLVQRTMEWYLKNGAYLSWPTIKNQLPTESILYAATPSDEQKCAIQGALSDPVSYIWGAPGTGKTRVVLASCVLSLVKSGQKVLLLAPTNNALEQIMLALLPVLDENGISSDSVLRLGTPSLQFAEKYPRVCEAANIDRILASIEKEYTQVKECLAFRTNQLRFEVRKQEILVLLEHFPSLNSAIDELKAKAALLKDEVLQHKNEVSVLHHGLASLKGQLYAQTKVRDRVWSKVHAFFSPSWLAALQADISQLEESIAENEKHWKDAQKKLWDKEMEYADASCQVTDTETARSDLVNELVAASAFSAQLKEAAMCLRRNVTPDALSAVSAALLSLEPKFTEVPQSHHAYDEFSDEDLHRRLTELSMQKERLQPDSTETRIIKSSVVGATTDKYMMLSFDPSHLPSHIFLDEAGYSSIIKAIPAFSLGIPITFLGDHMQLPPVCEIGNTLLSREEYRDVCLWAQSAIFAESAFAAPPEQLILNYLDGSYPVFSDTKQYTLNKTYRFGESLAAILSQYIYSPMFQSVIDAGTEIVVLDCPRRPGDERRTNSSEISSVLSYTSACQQDSFVILSPYRSQVSQFSRRAPKLARTGHILTVHASQGREWDTVVLSVVDTTDKWFTDSMSNVSNGRQVINTAISRAKRRLVLACDYSYWSKEQNQLIGQLVNAADEILHPAEEKVCL